jgi:hypothetical protein
MFCHICIRNFFIVTTHNTTRSFGDRLSNIKVLINISDKDQRLSLVIIACFNLARLKNFLKLLQYDVVRPDKKLVSFLWICRLSLQCPRTLLIEP